MKAEQKPVQDGENFEVLEIATTSRRIVEDLRPLPNLILDEEKLSTKSGDPASHHCTSSRSKKLNSSRSE